MALEIYAGVVMTPCFLLRSRSIVKKEAIT